MARIQRWADAKESRYVSFCNVHSVVTAKNDPSFRSVIAEADIALPDGAPIAWAMRRLGAPEQQRVSGPDFMLVYLRAAAARNEAVYFYGSTPETLGALQSALLQRIPGLRVAGSHSPPFRPLTRAEGLADIVRINQSGAGTVWVSLGCPKQERWMQQQRGAVNAVMLGVGAAFDFHAGTIKRAPEWMRSIGLEWLHRLASEPRRLWKRYLVTNTVFIWSLAAQLLRHGRSEGS